MRKIIFMLGTSLDGFFEGPERDISWHRVDEELHGHFNDKIRPMGMLLSGRITHELMVEAWPDMDDNPDASEVEVEFAPIWRDLPKWVFSSTWANTDWNTTVKREVDPEEIRALKAQPGGDMIVGGPDLARSFRRHGLIDEYHIYVHPVLIGRGRPAFPELDVQADLELVHTERFGNGVVQLQYRVRT